MKVLAKKMKKIGFLKLEFILGLILMVVAIIALPLFIYLYDPELLFNPTVLCIVLSGVLFFGLVAVFGFVRPYVLYRKYPEVQVESDGEYLYIHTKKEAKIPLSEITSVTVRAELPYIYQREFARRIVVNLLSEEFGDVVLEIPGFGNYKARFVSYANATRDQLVEFLNAELNKN